MGNKYFLLLCGGLLLTGCMAGSHMKNVQSDKGDRLTVAEWVLQECCLNTIFHCLS